MKKFLPHLLLALSAACFVTAWWLHRRQFVRYVEIAPPPGMTQAGLYLSNELRHPAGILVLADGVNSVGGALVRQEEWRAFARRHHLVLAEVAFASDDGFRDPASSCYYYAKNGSGDALLTLLDERFPAKPPLLLFGFSGGGHFASRFQEWRPDRVKAWAVTGVNWWDEPPRDAPDRYPPGIVMTGALERNLPRTIRAFRERHAQGRHLLWCGLADTEHIIPYFALPLVRDFFDAMLGDAAPNWQPVEIDGEAAGWVPSPAVRAAWQKLPVIPPFEPPPQDDEESYW